MSDNKLQTLKGFRDFGVKEMLFRKYVIKTLTEVFQKYGFNEIATPTLEYQDVLLGKYGAEAEKLMYLFKDHGGRDVGLKYDLTVPLARYVASHRDLPMPFKRYQIQPVWRAENTQKGRYREFYQCDIDTVGSNSPLADAEILAVISDSLTALKLPEFTIQVNSRPVLYSIMENAGISPDKWMSAIGSLDKLDKKSVDEVSEELSEKGFTQESIISIFSSLKTAKPDEYLTKVFEYATALKAKNVQFVPTISRGLDYYDGPIFETIVHEPKIGSITGGGRYNKLLKQLGGPDLPAVGTTIGMERIIDVVSTLNLWNVLPTQMSRVFISVFSEDLANKSIEVANKLRENGIDAELSIETNKLDRQLKYANENQFKYVVIIGPEEASRDVVKVKNMTTGEETETSAANLQQIVSQVS